MNFSTATPLSQSVSVLRGNSNLRLLPRYNSMEDKELEATPALMTRLAPRLIASQTDGKE